MGKPNKQKEGGRLRHCTPTGIELEHRNSPIPCTEDGYSVCELVAAGATTTVGGRETRDLELQSCASICYTWTVGTVD